jgi:hypothetical protein
VFFKSWYFVINSFQRETSPDLISELFAELSEMMGLLYAKVRVDSSETSELLIRRNQAYTLLKKTLDELTAQARFILRANRVAAAKHTIQPPAKRVQKTKPVTAVTEPVVAK